jgi:hypothetical protein
MHQFFSGGAAQISKASRASTFKSFCRDACLEDLGSEASMYPDMTIYYSSKKVTGEAN